MRWPRWEQGTRGGDVAHWLELHRAGSLLIDRKTGDRRTIYVPRAALSIAGTIQPRTLARALGQEHFENGLAARMLMAMPPKVRKRWTEAELSRLTEAKFESIIDRLLTLNHNSDQDGQPIPVDVPMTSTARAAWTAFYDHHADEQAEIADEDLEAAYSKAEAYAARFALIVHFIRWAAGDPTLTDAVDEQSIEAGVMLARWFCYETERIYGVLRETDEQAKHRRLVEWIRGRGGSVTANDLYHSSRRYATIDDAKAAFDELCRLDLGKWTHPAPGPKGGRPAPRFQLVDGVTVTKTHADDSASEGFSFSDGLDERESTHNEAARKEVEWTL